MIPEMRASFADRRLLLQVATVLLYTVAPVIARAEVTNPNGVAVIIGNKSYRHERVPEVSYDGHLFTAPVGSYTRNGYGLYDVLGNVAEWTEDCWNMSYRGAPTDGRAWERGECNLRLARGGNWEVKSRPSARPTAPPCTAPFSIATVLVFELPGRSRRESLRPYLGGPGGGSPLVARNFRDRRIRDGGIRPRRRVGHLR